jgi:hypothetical protein
MRKFSWCPTVTTVRDTIAAESKLKIIQDDQLLHPDDRGEFFAMISVEVSAPPSDVRT